MDVNPYERLRVLKARVAAELDKVGLELIAMSFNPTESDGDIVALVMSVKPDAVRSESERVDATFEEMMAQFETGDPVKAHLEGKMEQVKSEIDKFLSGE